MFKIRRVLSEKQEFRAKLVITTLFASAGLQVMAESAQYYYSGQEFDQMMITNFQRGRIVEFTNREEFCHR